MLDFGALPPEVNSGLLYSGPGSGPLVAAASAWDALAAEVGTTASGYNSVIGELTSGPWVGPASATMVSAVTPYVTWLSGVATQAEETANQARVAAAAYETAFTLTVPPPVIAANRVLLATLVATNFLGINSVAIAATEAQYAEMWAQDAGAMYGYAATSTAATTLTPFSPPPNTTTPDAAGDQANAVTNANSSASGVASNVTSNVTSNATSAATSTATTDPFTGPFALVENTIYDLFTDGLPTPTDNWIGLAPGQYTAILKQTLQAYFAAGIANYGWGIGQQTFNPPPLAAATANAGALIPKSQFAGLSAGGWTSHPTVSLASSSKIGGLSVPQGWAGAAESQTGGAGTKLVSAKLGYGPVQDTNAAMRGVPLTGTGAGRGTNHAVNRELRYGFRNKVLSRPPSAG